MSTQAPYPEPMPFLPLFPLNLVAFPGEALNLHIFEPRYIQLISECLASNQPFGIPVYLPNHVMHYGTSIQIVQLVKQYDDGRMDIQTQGLDVFRITTFQNPVQDKLYAGGEVEFLQAMPNHVILPGLVERLRELYHHLQLSFEFDQLPLNFSFQIGHKIGLSIAEEYQLIQIPSEVARQEFILRHLNRIMPIMDELERTKERIRLNGHFKNFDPLNF